MMLVALMVGLKVQPVCWCRTARTDTGNGGNGSRGGAFTGADVIPNRSAISNQTYEMTLGTANLSNATNNVCLVRIALASGESCSALSIGTPKMTITDNQKIDYLFKKIGYGATKTDTNAQKLATPNEAIPVVLLIRGDRVWKQAASIPAVKPRSSSGVVTCYTGSSVIETTADNTVLPIEHGKLV